jgi:hypothetical protein
MKPVKKYMDGGAGPGKKRKAVKSKASADYLAKKEKSKKEKEENALRIQRERREKMALKAEKAGDFERARRIRSQGETQKDKETEKRF